MLAARSWRHAPQVPAVPGGQPAVCWRRRSTMAQDAPGSRRLPDPMVWGARDPSEPIGDPKDALSVFDFEPVMKQERAAGALRLHGDRHRRRRHPARQPGRLPALPASPAPARRCEQDRHELRDPGHDLRQSDRDRAHGQQPRLPSRRRDGRRQGGQGRQPSADPFDGRDDFGRGRDGRARRADLVPALPDAPFDRRSARQARGAGRLPGDRADARHAGLRKWETYTDCGAPTRGNAAAVTASTTISRASRISRASLSAA